MNGPFIWLYAAEWAIHLMRQGSLRETWGIPLPFD
jgi:hypothetical protein